MMPRKIRVLALAGGHACNAVMKFQCSGLKAHMGDIAEWDYIEGPCDWDWYKGEPEVTEMEAKIASGKQLKNWYLDTPHTPDDDDRLNRGKQFGPEVWVEYKDVPASIKYLRDYIEKNGPFDVLI